MATQLKVYLTPQGRADDWICLSDTLWSPKMATLRNKSTDRGSIVRWKPHPDHTRPSTYQVEPSAISLLEDLGYEVPTPGDEAEVPWQVCRPLRILGDLHFENEHLGSVDTSDIAIHTDSAGITLSAEQRRVLRKYIESHPRYEAETRRELSIGGGDDSSDIQSTGPTDDRVDGPAVDHDDYPGIIPDRSVYIAKIHRYSNQGNAMCAPVEGGSERNLGDLPKSLAEEWTLCADYASDNIALCLTPQRWPSSYREMVRRNLSDLGERTGFGSLDPLLNIHDRDTPAELEPEPVSVWVSIAKDRYGIAYEGPWTVVVVGRLVTSGTRVDVEIVDRYDRVVIARPTIISGDERLDERDEILAGVEAVDKDRIVGTFQSRYVEIPNSGYTPGNRIRVGLEDVSPSQITGSVRALDRSDRPEAGEIVAVQDDMLVTYPYVPVAVPKGLPETNEELHLGVVSVDKAGVSVSVRARRDDYEWSVGDRLTHVFDAAGCLDGWFVYDGLPIRVEGQTPYPGVPLEVEITGFTDDYVTASVIRNIVDPDLGADVDSLVTTGTDELVDGRREVALEYFIRARGVAENSVEATRTSTLATIVACDQILDQQGPELAHRYCVAVADSAEVSLGPHADALRHVLESAWAVERATEAKEKIAATGYRADAKNALQNGVEVLRAVDMSDGDSDAPRVFEIIDQIMESVADEILSPSSSVRAYLK